MKTPLFVIAMFVFGTLTSSQLAAKTEKAASNPKQGAVSRSVTENQNAPAQVRVLLKMKPYSQVLITSPTGVPVKTNKEEREVEYTLRARINQPNHFYFADWHVESTPILWKQELREYGVRLSFFRTFGLNRELEERVGSIDVKGHLVAAEPKIYNLVASQKAEFKNAQGESLLVVNAGFNPKTDEQRMIVKGTEDTKKY